MSSIPPVQQAFDAARRLVQVITTLRHYARYPPRTSTSEQELEQATALLKALDEAIAQASTILDAKDQLSDGWPVELEGCHETSYHEVLYDLAQRISDRLRTALLDAYFDHPEFNPLSDPVIALQGRAPLSNVWRPESWARLLEALRHVPRLDLETLLPSLDCERIRAERGGKEKARAAAENESIPFSSPLSASDLARLLRQDGFTNATDNSVGAFLKRYRLRHDDCYITVDSDDRRRNTAKYLYRPEVWPWLVQHYIRHREV
jgi:hypothetical protein